MGAPTEPSAVIHLDLNLMAGVSIPSLALRVQLLVLLKPAQIFPRLNSGIADGTPLIITYRIINLPLSHWTRATKRVPLPAEVDDVRRCDSLAIEGLVLRR